MTQVPLEARPAEHHKLGGYETWLGTSRFVPEAEQQILAKLLEMTAALK